MAVPYKKSKNGITLKIKVETRSSQRGIAGLLGDAIKVRLHAPPVDGAANKELLEILSEEFKIKKSSIKILTGHSSKEKIVEISGADMIPDILKNIS